MARTQTSLRDEKREVSRRALMKWSIAAGAALGVSRSKISEILEKTGGKGLAFAANERPTARSVHCVLGNGAMAWTTLMWGQVDVAKAQNPNFAWIGPAMDVPGTPKPLIIGQNTPWANLPADRQVTCFTCGSNETHRSFPQSTSLLNGASLYAIATVLQSSSHAVLPVITVDDARIGNAPGAPAESNVGDANGIVSLFDSAASRMGALLSKPADAELYAAHYEAFIQLQRASNRSTTKTAYTTATSAAKFLGTNLSLRLKVSDADLARYGVTADTRGNVAAIARTLIITAKAFGMNLTNSIVFPAMRDDPHNAFSNGDSDKIPTQLKKVFDGFMADLTSTIDEATQLPLAADTVITFSGDTCKQALNKDGWGDDTRGNTNQLVVYSAGRLNAGWYGSILRDGTVMGFNPQGNPAPYDSALTAKYALASVAFAIAKGDSRAIASFANGLTIDPYFGKPKVI